MKFDIYIPTTNSEDDNSVTYFTSIEADSEQEAQEIAERMQKDGVIPSIYPY